MVPFKPVQSPLIISTGLYFVDFLHHNVQMLEILGHLSLLGHAGGSIGGGAMVGGVLDLQSPYLPSLPSPECP